MFDGTTPCWIPDIPSSKTATWRVRIAQFGDGYQQRTLDGINALDQKWTLTWQQRPRSVVLAMNSFLAAEKSSAFDFLDPMTGLVYRVVCDTWQMDLALKRVKHAIGVSSYWASLSAEFTKANGMDL